MSTPIRQFYNTTFVIISTSILLFSNAARAQESEYTSLNIDKKECQQDHTADYFSATCPSKASYTIEVTAGDNHTAVYVKYKQHKVNYLPDTPSDIGKVAEWRYRKSGDAKHYHALIYRALSWKIDNNADESAPRNLDKHELVVIKLDKEKSCILSIVPQSKDMNEKARKIADENTSKCMHAKL